MRGNVNEVPDQKRQFITPPSPDEEGNFAYEENSPCFSHLHMFSLNLVKWDNVRSKCHVEELSHFPKLKYFIVMITGYSDQNLPDAVNVDIGISVSLIVAIAVVIGALILTIGLVCFKRSVSHGIYREFMIFFWYIYDLSIN